MIKKLIALFLTLGVAGSLAAAPTVSYADTLYDEEKILNYVWEGTEVYQESVTPIKEKDGTIAPISLLFPIEQIIEVKNAPLTKTYTEGKDYAVENGKLIIKTDGNISALTYDEYNPTNGTAGFESSDGGYLLWMEGSWYHQRQIVVTYTHTGEYTQYIPEGKGLLLPKTVEKLKGEKLNVLVYGDSLSEGGNSSGNHMINTSPYMPIYPQLFCNGLKQKYGVQTVNLYNAAQGGTDSAWGLSSLRGNVFDKFADIDLAIVAFGANDVRTDPDTYASNMRRIAKGLKSKYKDAEVILVSSFVPNEKAVNFYGNQYMFNGKLMEFEEEGVAVANINGVTAGMLNIKKFADITGNNINHINDFHARVYAQTLLKTLEVSDYDVKPEEPTDSTDSVDSTDSALSGVDSESAPESVNGNSTTKACGSSVGISGSAVIACLVALAIKKRKND